MNIICDNIQSFSKLNKINLSYNNFGNSGLLLLLKNITVLSNLKDLNIDCIIIYFRLWIR